MKANPTEISGGLGFLGSAIGAIDASDGSASPAGTAAQGALSGASAGAMLGPVGAGVGALIGGVGGLIAGNKQKQAELAAERKAKRQRLGQQRLMEYVPESYNYASTFMYGGPLDNVTLYEGNSHANGGIPIGRTKEVEGNEVRYDSPKYGSYIFSNSLRPLK